MSVKSMSMDTKVDHLERLLREKVENMTGYADDATQCHKLNQIFRFFNADKDGWISFDEFNAALVRLNFVGKQDEVRALFERYDTDGSGFLSYEEFSAGLLGLIPNLKGDASARAVIERIRKALQKRSTINTIRGLGRAMRILDNNGNRKLDREEVKYGFRDFGVELNNRDLDVLFRHLDRNGDGSIDYDELIRGLRGNLSFRRRRLILEAYNKLDVDGSGLVTLEDIGMKYDATQNPEVISGKKTEQEVLEDFLSQFDTIEKDNIVTKPEFIEYYKDVSASIDTDDYFELMIRNAWHLDGGEGQYEATWKPYREVNEES